MDGLHTAQRSHAQTALYKFDPYAMESAKEATSGPKSRQDSLTDVGDSSGGGVPGSAAGRCAAGPSSVEQPVQASQPAQVAAGRCRVADCQEQISGRYFVRFRICRRHRDAQGLVIDGMLQRFCQQCGRFQPLAAFDGTKRTCKAKLERHNRLRRAATKLKSGSRSSDRQEPASADQPVSGDHNDSGGTSSAPPSLPPSIAAGLPLTSQLQALLYHQQVQQQQQQQQRFQQHKLQQEDPHEGQRPLHPASFTPRADLQEDDWDHMLKAFFSEDATGPLAPAPAPSPLVDPHGRPPAPMLIVPAQPPVTIALPAPPIAHHAMPVASSLRALMAPTGSHLLPHPTVPYVSQERVARMSFKVFNVPPDLLLPAVRVELETMLKASPLMLESFLRPGCVHLTINAWLPHEAAAALEAPDAASTALAALLRRHVQPLRNGDLLLQLRRQVAVGAGGQIRAVLDLDTTENIMPDLASVRPLCVQACTDETFTLHGRDIADRLDLPLCRQQGRNITLEIVDRLGCGASSRRAAGASSGTRGSPMGQETVQLQTLGLHPGFADFESQRGRVLSNALPVLVLPAGPLCIDAVCEVRQLESGDCGIADPAQFLRDTGSVLQYLSRDDAVAAGRAVPPYTPRQLGYIAGAARRLVAAALSRHWTTLATLLLPALTADGEGPLAALAAMDACCPVEGSVLRMAVATGCLEAVQVLVTWGTREGLSWSTECPAREDVGGMTPLQVAQSLPNGEVMQMLLTESLPADCRLWLKQHTCDTPPVGGSTTGVERKNGKPHVQGTISSCWAEQSGDEGAGLVVDNGSDSDELSLAQQVLRSERRSAFTALRLNCMALSIQPFAGMHVASPVTASAAAVALVVVLGSLACV